MLVAVGIAWALHPAVSAMCVSRLVVVCDHRARLSVYGVSARTLVVLDVNGCRDQFYVKNAHIRPQSDRPKEKAKKNVQKVETCFRAILLNF